ncbi:MAG: GxxExxY protein [Phycisphaerales bacterium]
MSEPGEAARGGGCSPAIEELSRQIIGAAIEVHRTLGPGMLESIYEGALCVELDATGVTVERQAEVVIDYKGVPLHGQRIDLLVGGAIIVELKAVATIQDVHKAQLLSYLRATRLPLGLLINFNEVRLKDGIRRVINERAL